MEERRLRLMKLIEHWAEHNDEHGERFKESAEEAAGMGLMGAADEMAEAHLKAAEVSRHLRSALKLMKEGS